MSRRKLLAIVLILSVVCFTACKKQACGDVVCPANAVCVNGTCSTVCGPNQHSEADDCVCDTGWVGNNCTVSVGQFAGRYHMYGTEHTITVGQNYTDTVDKLIEITQVGNGLYTGGSIRNYLYDEQASGSSAYYTFSWNADHLNNSTLKFVKGNDSLYFYRTLGGAGGATVTMLSGIKLQ
ncbi:MAG TPA: hypothetical protein PLW44_08445 [Chitinophagales bacterium]|nr:hypothetical protein [Chitinophagales bacterium]